MKSGKIKWSDGYRANVSAGIFAEEVERIKKEHGRATPPLVVKWARPKNSPIHKLFEWDDRKAAERWRIDQAGEYLRKIVVTVEEDTGPTQVRLYYSVTDSKGPNYRSMDEVTGNKDYLRQVLADARNDLLIFDARYRRFERVLKPLRPVFRAIRKVKGPS